MQLGWATLFMGCVVFGVVLAQGENLYPACGGIEHEATATANNESVIYTIDTPLQNITLTCFAHAVTSVTGGDGKKEEDHCRIEHQSSYAYRLVLRAVFTDSNGSRATRDYDLQDISGGSIASLSLRMPEVSTFHLVLINNAVDKQCKLSVRSIFTYTSSTLPAASTRVPVLIGADPPTVYATNRKLTTFSFRHPKGVLAVNTRSDLVMLTDWGTSCDAQDGLRYLEYSTSLPDSATTIGDTDTISARTYMFSEPGTYHLCYKDNGAVKASEMAVIVVFSGNPAYYDIQSGQDKDGRVPVGRPVTMKFYGSDLDTRVDGDRAKFVEESETCERGAPAGGVPIATDLGPADNYGRNTTFSLWTWTIQSPGAFKVCYKRRMAAAWTQVPSVTDINPGNLNPTTPSPSEYPVPTDPVTKQDCPRAPESTTKDPWFHYQSVKLTLSVTHAPPDFRQRLGRLLCVPLWTISVARMFSSADGHQVLYIIMDCYDGTEEGKAACDVVERLNYIVHLGHVSSPALAAMSISKVEGSTSMFAKGDDPTIVVLASSKLLSFLMLVTLGIIVAVAVLAVVKYKERRHYFNQFGMDGESDFDDMYAEGSIPAPMSNAYRNSGGASRHPIRDAVIEMEA